VLAIFKDGVDGAAEALRLADRLPAFLVAYEQALRRRQQDAPVGIDAAHTAKPVGGKGRIRPHEPGLARGQLKHARVSQANPEVAVAVLANGEAGLVREAAGSPEDGRPARVHPAEFEPASVPDRAAVRQNAVSCRIGSARRLRNGPDREFARVR
jgi:hypothetical protein